MSDFLIGYHLARLEHRLETMEATLMTALDDARARITAGLDELLDIARELKARIDATEDTTADTASLNETATRLEAGIEELRAANEEIPPEA